MIFCFFDYVVSGSSSRMSLYWLKRLEKKQVKKLNQNCWLYTK